MEVRKIIVTNFKSIKGTVTFDFERMQGVWKIGGVVGSGKTTVGEAILFGLFGDIKGKNNTDLVTWGEHKGFVEVFCNSKGHDIYIKREFRLHGQSILYVQVDGQEITYTNKRDAQAQLETEYFDVSKMTLEMLCIISFNNFKSLATLNTQDAKAFLDQVFGFYLLTQYGEVCKQFRSEVETSVQETSNNISNIKSQIEKITQLSNYKRIEGDIREVTNKILQLEAERSKELNRIKEELIQLRKTWTATQSEISSIKILGQNKKKEIDFIKKGTCPTCGAPIDQSQLPIKEMERENLLKQYQEKVTLGDKQQNDIIEKEAEQSKIETKYREQLVEQRQLKTQLEEQEKRLSINLKEIDGLKINLEEQNKILEEQQKDSNEWKTLQDAITIDVRQKVLLSFIPLLNQSISFYTKQLQLPYSILFDESFQCSIYLTGLDRKIPISSLSTGQLKTVDISIIMGVLKTIMSNVNFNISFLDELISNMDEGLRDIICKVLKSNLRPKQVIFIISHIDMDPSSFGGVIEAELNTDETGLPYSTYKFLV